MAQLNLPTQAHVRGKHKSKQISAAGKMRYSMKLLTKLKKYGFQTNAKLEKNLNELRTKGWIFNY